MVDLLPQLLLESSLQATRSFFVNDPAPTAIYTLSLHDALPIFGAAFPLIHLRQGNEDLREKALAPRRTRSRHRVRSEEHTSELQSQSNLVCRLLLEKKTATSSGRRRGARH